MNGVLFQPPWELLSYDWKQNPGACRAAGAHSAENLSSAGSDQQFSQFGHVQRSLDKDAPHTLLLRRWRLEARVSETLCLHSPRRSTDGRRLPSLAVFC